jgi:hypothetical protein
LVKSWININARSAPVATPIVAALIFSQKRAELREGAFVAAARKYLNADATEVTRDTTIARFPRTVIKNLLNGKPMR